ncbi:2-amino-5-chloromuconic acid deaminase [Microbulbifer aestuariivivens]|uniref:2-amino-5-chloromuconic acid deaminase n=1 Tax=Microbulbifer aestuariivivens TaxID=1908308 RepID=A0ABP9WQD5_9GAMM
MSEKPQASALLKEDATALAARLRSGDLTSEQLTAATLAAIDEQDGSINAYNFVDAEAAMEASRASDARRREGRPLSEFDGLTVAVKDNIDVAGMPTSSGLGYKERAPVADTDASVVTQLRAAGLIIIGKLNMHEIALGATNDNPHWGRCENPLRAGYTPGGSSGGSGAAVAAGICAFALGTDTMGSVRIPASYCGVAGVKPGRDQIAMPGVTRLCGRLDTVGPLARSSRDLKALWPLICRKQASVPDGNGSRASAALSSIRWGVIDHCEKVGTESEIAETFREFADHLPGADKVRRDFSAMDFSAIRRAGLLWCEAEANITFASELQAQPEIFSAELQRLLRWGADRSAPELVRAMDTVEAAGAWLRNQLEGIDFLLTPTTLQTAFPFSSAAPANQANLTSSVNMAGLAAASIPLGTTAEGLPFGLQIIARAGDEARLLEICVALEQHLCHQGTPATA